MVELRDLEICLRVLVAMPQMGRRYRSMASLSDERAFLRSIDVTFYSVKT